MGLASQFLFARDVKGLGLPEAALLVGMIRGPSLYDPRRHPERARERRDKVIDILVERGAIDGPTGDRARRAALGVVPAPPGSGGAHPAFIELVRRQLQREYREEDLTSEGLRIFTTLDASVQEAAEIALSERLAAIERARKIPALKLEGAVIATEPQTGEVLAAVGGRGARYEGFNRVLDAVRPIGSLVKPAVYLAAFSQPERFTLATRLDDGPFSLKLPAGNVWTPHNYDGEHHGEVLAWRALRDSLNIATVRLGLGVGLDRVLGQVHAMGVGADFSPYPSTLLGAGGMSPAEVAQMYQVFAAGGFVTPLRAIREVLSADGQPLTRYPLTVERAADPRAVYLVNAALEAVTRNGTARSLAHTLPGLRVAGKTGTTNDQRDSWFAGFTEDRLVVVWVGRDDNGPTGLTGATGALPVFSDILAKTGARSFDPIAPEGVEELAIEPVSGLRGEGCENTIRMPFYAGSAPREAAPCARGVIEQGVERVRGWVEGLME